MTEEQLKIIKKADKKSTNIFGTLFEVNKVQAQIRLTLKMNINN